LARFRDVPTADTLSFMRAFFRFLRPQFSLRAILLLMGFVGVALAIWRWPWQEDVPASYFPRLDAPPEFVSMHAKIVRTRMQFRRGWWGERLKYGPAESFDEQGRLIARQNFHDDFLNGPETWFDLEGRPIVEQHRHHGQRSGPFRYGDGFRSTMSGQYDNQWRSGECHDDEQWQSGQTVERISHWKDRRLHGPCTWQVAETGEVLQRGVYENGALVEWNGQPISNFLKQWAATGQLEDRESARLLLETANKPLPFEGFALQRNGVHVQVGKYKADYIPLFLDPSLRPVYFPPPDQYELGGQPAEWATEEILAAVIPWGLTIDQRYGHLWMVPAEDAGRWRDPTGVDKIQVVPNSKLADAWNLPHRYHESGQTLLLKQAAVEELITWWPRETEVVLDFATHFPELHRRWNENDPQAKRESPNYSAISLRHWLGMRLYQAGLQCELDGNRLVILPHWSQRLLSLQQKEASATPQSDAFFRGSERRH
jgi:hypothetical protein